MPLQQSFRPPAPVSAAAARSTNLIEPAQSAFRAIREAGATLPRPNRLRLADHELRQHVLLQVSKFGPQIARTVSFDVRHGEVTLSGVVGSDYGRSLIGQSVGRLAGVQHLSNEIDVRDHRPMQQVASRTSDGQRKLTWKVAAIAGVLAVVAASLLLVFQVANAAAADGRPGLTPLGDDGLAESSTRCISRAGSTECCLSLQMRR